MSTERIHGKDNVMSASMMEQRRSKWTEVEEMKQLIPLTGQCYIDPLS
jgi:hypothetical protein